MRLLPRVKGVCFEVGKSCVSCLERRERCVELGGMGAIVVRKPVAGDIGILRTLQIVAVASADHIFFPIECGFPPVHSSFLSLPPELVCSREHQVVAILMTDGTLESPI